jgi:glutamate racemase
MDSPIGIFDSGVGGLTVLQEVRRIMPNESIIYVGDTARVPYGGKDPQTLISYGREIINFLLNKGAKAVIMACGTSSSTSYEPLRAEFPNLPIIDTIRPAAKVTAELANQNPNLNPVFIATAATVKSGLFQRLFTEQLSTKSSKVLHARACPMFAPMVEAGLTTRPGNPLLHFAAETYLADLRGKVNALILGCTHYPLLTNTLTQVLGNITFINPATATAQAAKTLLVKTSNPKPVIEYYTSGDIEVFGKLAKFVLNQEIEPRGFAPHPTRF